MKLQLYELKHPHHVFEAGNIVLSVLTPVNFLLSFLIVFHHGFTMNIDYNGNFAPSSYGMTMAIERYMYNLSECAVPVFFFISAFLFYRTFDGTWINYKKKMKRRIRSLLVPYLIFCTLGYVKSLVFNGGLGGYNFSDYLLSLWESNTMPLWFIRELIALSLLAPIFWQLLKRPVLAIFICIFMVILTSLGYIPYRSFFYWIPVYMMGAAMNYINADDGFILRKVSRSYIGITMVLAYAIVAWFLPNGIARQEMTIGQNTAFALFRLSTPVIWLVIIDWLSILKVKEHRFMNYSFFVYCMHAPIITLLTLIYTKTVTRLIDVEIVQYVSVIFGAYFFCVLLAMALQQYVPWLWSVLNGKR